MYIHAHTHTHRCRAERPLCVRARADRRLSLSPGRPTTKRTLPCALVAGYTHGFATAGFAPPRGVTRDDLQRRRYTAVPVSGNSPHEEKGFVVSSPNGLTDNIVCCARFARPPVDDNGSCRDPAAVSPHTPVAV